MTLDREAPVIVDATQITPEWLTTVLHSAGAFDRGHVVAVEAAPAELPGISRFARLALRFSPDAPASAPSLLFLKLSPPITEHTRPFLRNREVAFYRALQDAPRDLPIPRCYDAASDPGTGAYHLLLDDLSGTHIAIPAGQMPPQQMYCEQMVAALARIHAFCWNHPRRARNDGELSTVGSPADFAGWAEQTYPRFADFLGDRLSASRRQILEQTISALPGLLQRLTRAGHVTVTHGDAHWGNFLFPKDASAGHACIVDWDWWHVTVGPMDLAYQMALMWFPERRARLERPLLRQYHDLLEAQGVAGYDWAACWDDYRRAVLRLMFVPIWRWSLAPYPDFWWLLFEKIMSAVEDLACTELLDE